MNDSPIRAGASQPATHTGTRAVAVVTVAAAAAMAALLLLPWTTGGVPSQEDVLFDAAPHAARSVTAGDTTVPAAQDVLRADAPVASEMPATF
jgi:hypothetical protein